MALPFRVLFKDLEAKSDVNEDKKAEKRRKKKEREKAAKVNTDCD